MFVSGVEKEKIIMTLMRFTPLRSGCLITFKKMCSQRKIKSC